MVAIFAGALLSAAFEPFALWFLAPISYAIFFTLLKKSKRPIFTAFLFGFTSNAIILYWTGTYVGAIPWILLSILQSAFYLPLGYIAKKVNNIFWLIPASLVLEEVRARFPFQGFGWTRIAFSQVAAPYAHLVAFGGVALLTFATLLLAYLLIVFVHGRKKIIVLAGIFSIIVLPDLLPKNDSPQFSMQVLGIQGNTPERGLNFNERARAVFDLHLAATYKFAAEKKFDLIVWPENAVDIDPFANADVGRDLKSLAIKMGTPVIVGAVLNSRGAIENASIMYSNKGAVDSIYIKRHLTPFGEYMPLRSIAKVVSPYAALVNDFSAGKERIVHRVGRYNLGPIICFELIDDGLVRDMAIHSGALIVQTNSATFAGTSESAQQLQITRLRAIEHSRYILSVSTVGISALIDNNGAVQEISEENRADYINGKLEISNYLTFSDRIGGAAPLIVIIISIAFALLARKTKWIAK